MTLHFGAFDLDPKRRTLTCQGQRVNLLSRPFDILVLLIQARDRVVSREEMQAAIWPGQIATANNMAVQISGLRRMLALHGAKEVIITVPGRGYRFVAEVTERLPPPVAPATLPPGGSRRLAWPGIGARSAALGAVGIVAAAAAAAAIFAPPPAARFPARVEVETVPDTVAMVPNGYCKVDYVFRVLDATDLQLASEDVRFNLTSGEPLSPPSIGGRIYHGSFTIRGRETGIYRNNIWLPPDVAAVARAHHGDALYLRHTFHLIDPHGTEITAPAILKIIIAAPDAACTVPAGR